MNSCPGSIAGVFVHEKHHDLDLPRFSGWWGHDKESRFKMPNKFSPIKSAEGWQLSNPPILSLAAIRASLSVFDEVGMDRLIMYLTNNQSIQEVLFFPQMKPERQAPAVELNDDEKAVFAILQKAEKIELNELKTQSGLSNKKWDKTIKGLTKNKLASVSKTDEGLFVVIN